MPQRQSNTRFLPIFFLFHPVGIHLKGLSAAARSVLPKRKIANGTKLAHKLRKLAQHCDLQVKMPML